MSPEELQDLLEHIPMPACVMRDGRVVAANRRLGEMTGHAVGVLVTMEDPIPLTVSQEDQPLIAARMAARARGEPVPDEYDFTGKGPDGNLIPSRLRVGPFPLAGPGAVLILSSDERGRDRSAALIRGFVDVAVAAQQERSRGTFFLVVRERLLALGLHSTVLELEGDRFRIAPFAPAMTRPGVEVRERLGGWVQLARLPFDVSTAEGALIEDVPALLSQVVDAPLTDYEGRVPRRGVVTAILIAGEPRYVLFCSGEALDRAVAGAFGLLGRQLGAALETTLRLEELDRRNTELSLLLDLGQEVLGALDVERVLEAAPRTAARALRCTCAYVMVPNDAGTALRIVAVEDPAPSPDALVGSELPFSQASLSALALRTQRPEVSIDNQVDPRVDADVVRRFRCTATLAVPLLSHGRALGVLTLFERSGRAFDAQDVRLASHAGQLISAALENARLYDEQRGRAEEMALVNDVARRLAGSLELRPLLELGGETLRRLLDGDFWFMMLPTPGGVGLSFYALRPEHADLAGKVLRFDEPSVAVSAFRERRVVQMLDPLSSPGTASREMAIRFGNRVTLAVPLMARDECVGVGVVLGRHARTFSQVEMDRAQAVAGQLALALLSARLYDDLRGSYAELERTQKELIDRERLAALGALSASIAHEVRNPLGVIFNSVGSLRRLLKPEGDVSLLLDIVGEEADRLNRMVGDLLDYSRPVRPALEPLPLSPLIHEAVAAARLQIGAPAEAVQVKVQVDAETATVRADARLLRQALVNLFLNAHQAMPRGGVLEVIAARRDGQAEIAIRDSGAGILPDVREKIFQPFFTTKAMGTGLGLAVVRRIVEGHGGSVELAEGGPGAEFRLRLPLDA